MAQQGPLASSRANARISHQNGRVNLTLSDDERKAYGRLTGSIRQSPTGQNQGADDRVAPDPGGTASYGRIGPKVPQRSTTHHSPPARPQLSSYPPPAGPARTGAAFNDIYPVQWTGKQAVVALPEQIDLSNAGQIREELLSVINRGAKTLVADMTATLSCDNAGTDAVVRAHKRAVVSGTDLRLVVSAQIVQRVLSLRGLDRLVSIYPCLEAATAARARSGSHPAGRD